MMKMSAKYIFRIDDFAPNMNWQNYLRVKDVFIRYGVKPLIGVIPENCDHELKKLPLCPSDFWQEVRDVQKLGWAIAVHGYRHVWATADAGLLGINRRSEFAGLGYAEQYQKIKVAREIFLQQGVNPVAFMAPAHSYDVNTLKALKEAGIMTVTDGHAFFPYEFSGILFVPQLFAVPRELPWGVYTFCLHLNNISPQQIERIEKFIGRNRGNIISFQSAGEFRISCRFNQLAGRFLGALLKLVRKVRR